jgi:C-terminal processing protease CtpA/Prc
VHFGLHPSGAGYIKIESFNGGEEITRDFDHALEALRDAPGLILDIRDNTGGFGHSDITGRFVQERTGWVHLREEWARPHGLRQTRRLSGPTRKLAIHASSHPLGQ